MITSHTVESLREFERGIADAFNAGQIRAPVHLSGGNEAELLEIFRNVAADDWVFSNWRSHYHALLKGVPPDELRAAIMAGKSITLNFPAYRVFSSAIVAGICPIAVGVAWQTKRAGRGERVFCFIGDMAADTGLAHESMAYAQNFGLPVEWVIEENWLSVCSPTDEVWGRGLRERPHRIRRYSWSNEYPHAGAGVRVSF